MASSHAQKVAERRNIVPCVVDSAVRAGLRRDDEYITYVNT